MDVAPISLETVTTRLEGLAPDGGSDQIRTLGDLAADGLGQLCVSLAIPGAGEPAAATADITNSAARVTIVTPAAGLRTRFLGATITTNGGTAVGAEIYFGTGASLATNANTGVSSVRLDVVDYPNAIIPVVDGAGHVGAVDEVLSIRVGVANVGETLTFVVHTRDE